MKTEDIHTLDAPDPVGPYVQAKRAGDFLFCSGQIPIDPRTNRLVMSDIEAETIQVLENLKVVLEAGGSSLDDTVKVTIYLANMKDFPTVNTIYGEYFTNKPARACVEVSSLPKGVRIEVDAIAVVSE